MILQVARAGAVFPMEFPGFDEPGPAVSRATAARLRGAARRASGPRLAVARSGARTLIAQGLLDHPRPRLVQGIGGLADDPAAQRELTAVAALAIATVSSHFDPDSDHAAQRWIGGLRELHRRAWPTGKEHPMKPSVAAVPPGLERARRHIFAKHGRDPHFTGCESGCAAPTAA